MGRAGRMTYLYVSRTICTCVMDLLMMFLVLFGKFVLIGDEGQRRMLLEVEFEENNVRGEWNRSVSCLRVRVCLFLDIIDEDKNKI